MVKMFVIRWQSATGKTWESERWAYSAREALASSRHSRHRSCAWPVQSSLVKSADRTDWEG